MSLALKPTHATVKAYYETLHQYGQLHIDHEGAVRSAFQESPDSRLTHLATNDTIGTEILPFTQ
jgi:hypothetical protein